MNNRLLPLAVLAVAVAIVATIAWEPLRSRAGLLSPWPSPTPTPAASPPPSTAPRLALADETETKTDEPTPTPGDQPRRFEKCLDGSDLQVVAPGKDGAGYKCASGAEGGYLRQPTSQ